MNFAFVCSRSGALPALLVLGLPFTGATSMGIYHSVGVEKLISVHRSHASSAATWIERWKKYKDGSSVKNALFALGKAAGSYALLIEAFSEEKNIPQELRNCNDANGMVFDELMLVYLQVRNIEDIK